MEKKKFVVNCATCDARHVTDETFAPYETTVINCAEVLTTAWSREVLNRNQVVMNCANIIDLPDSDDVRIVDINGSMTLTGEARREGKFFLLLNGALTIAADAGPALENCVGMDINGSVTCPSSLASALDKAKINGSTTIYPDEAIVMKRSTVVDRTFALRAKEALYWAGKRFVMVDSTLDAKRLRDRGCRFQAREVIIAESLVEELIDLIDESAEIIIVPDGTKVVLDDLELDAITAEKLGGKLYVAGDLKVRSTEAVKELEYLVVLGDVSAPAALLPDIRRKAERIEGKLHPLFTGRKISEGMKCRISAWTLEQEPKGLRVQEHLMVTLDKDVSRELIRDRLTIREVLAVICTEEQAEAVQAVSDEVLYMGPMSGITAMVREKLAPVLGEDTGKGLLDKARELLHTKVLNGSNIVL